MTLTVGASGCQLPPLAAVLAMLPPQPVVLPSVSVTCRLTLYVACWSGVKV